MEELDEQTKLRKFILDDISDDEQRAAIEERLLADDEYFEEVLMAEENLIQDYADGNLEPAERERFEKRFQASEKNRQKVKFARALRKYARAEERAPETENKPRFRDALRSFFFAPVPIALAVLAIAAVIGFFVWKNSSNNSEVLIALNKAFKDNRPTEARISGLDYAPRIEGTRGDNKDANLNLVSARSRAVEAVLKNESAENLHELGRVYLAEGNYEEAVRQFEKALGKNSGIAAIHNDLGVALMEKGRQKEEGSLELFANANAEIEKAIELDKNLTEAYFNRALVIEALKLPNQAKEAWENYLKLDSASQWANEAREHLRKLNTNKPISKTKEEVLQDFLAAHKANDKEKAWQTLSQNREMITGKLIPQQLAFLFVEAQTAGSEAKAKEALDALLYAGKLEEEKSGDLFWRDLAKFYSNLPPEKYAQLKSAHESNFEGYRLAVINDFKQALDKFRFASDLFTRNGNLFEAQISNNYVAYCLGYTDKNPGEIENDRIAITNRIIEFARKNDYKWLQLVGLTRMASIQNDANQYSSAIRSAEESYEIAKNIEDSYAEQRALGLMALLYSRLGQKKKAIDHTRKIFARMNDSSDSLRQKWRNYFSAVNLFASVRLYSVARIIAREEILVAEQIAEPGVLSISQTQAAVILDKTNNLAEARELLNKGTQNAQKLPSEKARKNLVAYSLLKLADLEQEIGNHDEAARLYDESFKTNDSPYFEFEIQKGRLRSFLALGNDAELERQIPSIIKTAEENRTKILEEQQSNSFFHSENGVFETAIEWEFGRGNAEKAYNYAESASARSLLDFIEKGKNPSLSNEKFNSTAKAKPLELSEIRQQLPENVQLLQYTVLEKKVLIWVISKDKFIVRQSLIDSDELQNKVERYISLVTGAQTEPSAEPIRLSRELYSILIQPVRDVLNEKQQICVIPNKILFFLPFSSLISPQEKTFLEEFVNFYAPSANIFIHCTRNAEKKAAQITEIILSVGNPAFDPAVFPGLSNLKQAEMEAESIAKFYDRSEVLLGKAATKQAFRKSVAEADIIHFAGHYVVNPDLPLASSLLFAKDGQDFEQSVLTNAELINEDLKRLKLVILSSCETGVESYLNGEGMLGLSRTFLALETPLVVASQWKVDSEATASLMKNFHRFRREQKLSTVAALRKAQLEMLNESKFKSPYYWAAFAAFGGYSVF